MLKIKHIEIINTQKFEISKMNVEEQMYKMCTKCFDTVPFKNVLQLLKKL